MPLVFQYGSNMSFARLNGADRLQGHVTESGVAETLEIYEFVFDIWSGGKNNCAAADLIPGQGRRIWGVLYDIPMLYIERDPARKRRTLDGIEGEGENYSRTTINLRYSNSSPVPGPVFTYLGLKRKENIHTSSDYVAHILQGLAEHPEIPADYVQYVRAQAFANDPNLQLA